jgi:hypothetical protein
MFGTLESKKLQITGDSYIIKNFRICTVDHMLLGDLKKE